MTLRSRLIPVLLVRDGLLVKTTQFSDDRYVGDPINAIRIFNEKEADELLLADIGATVQGKGPDFNSIRKFAAECRMPLAYVGGIENLEQIERLIGSGVEKIGISSQFFKNPRLIRAAVERLGSQSVMGVVDVSGTNQNFRVLTHNGTQPVDLNLPQILDSMQSSGVGEIVVNSIDRDGTRQGFDRQLIQEIMAQVSVPITVVGGASELDECANLDREFGPLGIGVGSLFVFKGKHRAVLITYPSPDERLKLFA
jgi:cyclase